MYTLAIDPGKQHLGYAWGGLLLMRCGVSKLPPQAKVWALGEVCMHHAQNVGTPVTDRVVCERMSLNKGRDSTLSKAIATGNDLLQLQAIAAFVAGRVCGTLTYTTHFACPKDVTKNRVLSRLTPSEMLVVSEATGKLGKKDDDLFDAIAHWLRAVGRFG